MITCQFNIPMYDNDRQSLTTVHHLKQRELVDKFGGFTTHEAEGQWRSEEGRIYKEMVKVYTVSVKGPSDVLRLKSFAMGFARAARQEALYFATVGKAVILSTKENDNESTRYDQSSQQQSEGLQGAETSTNETLGQGSSESGNGAPGAS